MMKFIPLVILLTGCALLPSSNVAQLGVELLENYCELPEHERLFYRNIINQSKHRITITCSAD